jgi:thiamine transporter ThiT
MTICKTAPVLLALCLSTQAADGTSSAFPLRFEPNAGQTAAAVALLSRGPNYTLILTPGAATLRAGGSIVKMNLIGANPNAEAVLLDRLESRVHYLIGEPHTWQTDVPTYARVEYRNVYPGIHIAYYGVESIALYGEGQRVTGRLEYDFVLDPGADPSQIRLRLEGPERMQLDANGDLLLRTSEGEWRHTAPRAYQLRKGARQEVAGHLVAGGPDEFTFEIGEYDRSRPLVIDPALTYSTFLGGSGQDSATAIAVDSAGNTYVTGYTESTDFPEAPGSRLGGPSGVDVYVAKMSPAGQLLYFTYLGGSGDDRGYGIAVDSAGSAIVTGWTYSANFPILSAAQPRPGGGRDGFVAKLTPAGNALVFSTLVGGSGADSGNAVAVDQHGNIYVAGETASANFPVFNGLQPHIGGGQDAFLAKFNGAGARLYSTYLGGIADDRATAVAVDASGNAYITGSTYSPNFPVISAFQPRLGGGQDAFAAKIGPSGTALLYSTYLGGSGGTVGAPETGTGIAVDSAGYAYVAGTTSSSHFPTSNPLQSSLKGSQDAFVLKLSVAGNALVYSTYLGGSSVDMALAVAIDNTGRAYVAGHTASSDFPTVNALQPANAGAYDAFIVKLAAAGNVLEMATYLGGTGSDSANGIALDSIGGVYISGQTLSPDFPAAAAIQAFPLSAMSAFVAKLGSVIVVNPQLVSPAAGTVLSAPSVTFTWNPVPGATDYWIDVGTAPAQGNIIAGYTGGATSFQANLSGYLTGGTIYVQLYSKYPCINMVPGTGSQFHFSTSQQQTNPQLISPTAGTVLSTSPVTFTWNAVSGAQDYWIDVGTSAGRGDIVGTFTAGAPSSSVNLSGYLTGQTIYVQLYSKYPGVNLVPGTGSQFHFSTSQVRTNPQLISPAAGTVLSTSPVTFTWNAVSGAQDYWIDVGTSAGRGDLIGTFTGGTTSFTASLLGYLTGRTIYVQLYSKYPGINLVPGTGSQFRFSTSQERTNPQLISPAAGTVLSASLVTFTWNPVSGAEDYWIDVGTAPAQGNIIAGYTARATFLTVNLAGYLTGRTIYVQLYSKFPGFGLVAGTGQQFQFASAAATP